MAKNWKASEGVRAIQNGEKDAIMDIGRRFPLFVNAASKGNYDGLVTIIEALPEYITVRKIEAVLKEGVQPIEDDAEEEIKEEKPAKKSKKVAKKVEEPEEEEWEDEEEEEESKPKKKSKKKGGKKSAKKLKKVVEEDDDDEEEDEDWDI